MINNKCLSILNHVMGVGLGQDTSPVHLLQDTLRRSDSSHLLRECSVREATTLSDDLASHLLAESVLNPVSKVALATARTIGGGRKALC